MAIRQLTLTPIGVVKNDAHWPEPARWETLESELVIETAWAEALAGIEDFSHLVVIFWIDRASPPDSPTVHPEQRDDMPLVGLFATRSPNRPNPIGLSVVELVGRQGRVLRVRGLDAFDETPILDLKPYLARGDRIEAPRHPAWLERVWAEEDDKVTE
jgi:tRNA-Thr(GGU) m(6)t(6)A37 methyltransferase TsaA